MLKNSPKVIKDKHIKQDCNKCLIKHWKIDMNIKKAKNRKAEQKLFMSFALIIWVELQMMIT